MSKIKFLAATCLSTSLLLSAGFTNVAQAEEINQESQEKIQLPQEQIDYMKSFFNEYNVDNETQLQLIEKVENGILMDCYLENKQPIDTYTTESGNVTETVDVYEDGSIIVTALDLSEAIVEESQEVENNNKPSITPFAIDISDGSVTSGSGYTNYKNAFITAKSATIPKAGFYADFTVVNGGYSYISYVNQSYYLTLFGGYANNESLTTINAKETGSAPAEAILKWTFVAGNGGASTTGWLKLHIQNSRVTTPNFL